MCGCRNLIFVIVRGGKYSVVDNVHPCTVKSSGGHPPPAFHAQGKLPVKHSAVTLNVLMSIIFIGESS